MTTPTLPPLDFAALPSLPYWTQVRTPLFEVMDTIANRIDRDLRTQLEARAAGMRMWLRTHLLVSRHIYQVIEAISVDRKQLALGLEISVALPPLARVILESLFAVTFVFESPTTRLPMFWKATWRQIAEQCIEYTRDYGTDPQWQSWIARLVNERNEWQRLLDQHGTPLTPQEISNHEAVMRWPTPGKMKSQTTDPDRKSLIAYFQAKYYGPFSAAAHLSGTGVLAQGGVLLRDRPDDERRKYFSDQFLMSLTVLFSLLSQLALDVVGDPALARRLVGLWTTPNMTGAMSEAYERGFKAPLEALASR